INPHFLFNTLNIITQTAQMEDAEETAALIEATADFLRYNLSKLNKVVTLADEVENTQNYVYIQKQRFGDRFTFDFEIDERCTAITMPCMILQPLVENSIRHGLNNMLRGAKVAIRAYPGPGGSVCLEVWDNGVGISAQKQAKLLRSFEATDDSGHIGLRNVYKRLRLFYGKNLRIEFDSVPGSSAVRFVLPPQELALGPNPNALTNQ
ncbi:MAG: histidine kinase, partial [Oscillospiraceae bacterium]|nr:histidine kinase [Oscillospiraceae bacterium]